MNGDTVSLPIYGTVRRHEWRPETTVTPPLKPKPSPRPSSIEARLLALLAVTPAGLTALEVRSTLRLGKEAVASKLSLLVKGKVLFTDGTRMCGPKLGRIYKLIKEKNES
jgi:hypothetical protein